jgi:uncharacterized C2H2 Zn-finger protein
MASCRTSFVSILNNDDNPSFAVPSAPRLPRNHSTSSYTYPPEEQRPQPLGYSANPPPESPSPRVMRQPFDPVSEAVHPASPGSSDCSHDYSTHSNAPYYSPYGRQDLYSYPPSASLPPSERRLSLASVPEPPSPQTSLGGGSKDQASKGPRKNKYPCPYAASHGCSATFTTSGHAARHGKKHTGEKSVHCPVCNKAFTRKDNMKQHIRTHRTHSEDMPMGRDADPSAWAGRSNPAYHHHHHHRSHSRSISQSQINGHFYMTGAGPPTPGHHPMPFRS